MRKLLKIACLKPSLSYFLVAFLIIQAFLSNAYAFDLTINTENPGTVVNSNLFGFGAPEFRFCDIGNESFRRVVVALNSKTMRFPHGYFGNFYHWKEKGYGFKEDELDMIGGNAHKAITKYFSVYREGEVKENFVDKLIEYDRLSTNKVLLIANILTGTEQEFLDLIKYLKQNKVQIAGVELGNELYSEAYRKLIPNVNAYIEKAERFAKAIRAKYPDLKLAVVAAPGNFERKLGFAQSRYFNEWNNTIAKKDFYDAYVIHSYKEIAECEKAGSIDEQFECAARKADESINSDLPRAVKYYHALFGAKRKIWLTEWNVKESAYFGNTVFHAFYASEFLLKLIELDAQSNTIEYANYFCLCAKWLGYAMVNPKLQDEEVLDSGADYKRRTQYYPFLFMKGLFSDNVIMLESKVLSETGKVAERATMYAFVNTKEEYLYIYILNKMDKSQSVNLIINGKGFEFGANVADYQYVRASSVYAGMGVTGLGKEYRRPATIGAEQVKINSIIIHPYSIGYVKVKIKNLCL
ncbi:MAG: hypothetical protein HY887_01840 [Deltaproteobacteria bacterium]|nr:hypothetical protein [Deltaproteobacteria bacterium]